MNYEYLTEDFAAKTKYKSLREAIDRDHFSVVKYGNCVWLNRRMCPPSIVTRAHKEIKRIYPNCLLLLD